MSGYGPTFGYKHDLFAFGQRQTPLSAVHSGGAPSFNVPSLLNDENARNAGNAAVRYYRSALPTISRNWTSPGSQAFLGHEGCAYYRFSLQAGLVSCCGASRKHAMQFVLHWRSQAFPQACCIMTSVPRLVNRLQNAKKVQDKMFQYEPRQAGLCVPVINMLLCGGVGAGKSSIVSTIDSICQGRISRRAPHGQGTGSLTRMLRKYKFVQPETKEPVKWQL